MDLADAARVHAPSWFGRVTEASLALLDQLEEQGLLGTRLEPHPLHRRVHRRAARARLRPQQAADEGPVDLRHGADLLPRSRRPCTRSSSSTTRAAGTSASAWSTTAAASRWTARWTSSSDSARAQGLHEPLGGRRARRRRIGRDLVFSRKPTPGVPGSNAWHPELVERICAHVVETCARHGCPLELILKDISTVHYQPQRLWEWAEIAKKVVGA